MPCIKSSKKVTRIRNLQIVNAFECSSIFNILIVLNFKNYPRQDVRPLFRNVSPGGQLVPIKIYCVCSHEASWKQATVRCILPVIFLIKYLRHTLFYHWLDHLPQGIIVIFIVYLSRRLYSSISSYFEDWHHWSRNFCPAVSWGPAETSDASY